MAIRIKSTASKLGYGRGKRMGLYIKESESPLRDGVSHFVPINRVFNDFLGDTVSVN
jgi:hypothetical protein